MKLLYLFLDLKSLYYVKQTQIWESSFVFSFFKRTRSPDKNYQIHLLLILSQRLLRTIHIQSESRFAKMIMIINCSLETFSEWKYVIRDFLLFRQNGCRFQKLNTTLEIIVNVGKKLDRKKRGAEETWFAGGLTQPLN